MAQSGSDLQAKTEAKVEAKTEAKTKAKTKAKQEKILALSFDMDGCMLRGVVEEIKSYLDGKSFSTIEKAIEKAIQSCHHQLIDKITREVKEQGYTKVIVMSGSTRQTRCLDEFNARQYRKRGLELSSLKVLAGISEVLTKKLSGTPVECDPFLLEDTFESVLPGETFKSAVETELDAWGRYTVTPFSPQATFLMKEKLEIVYGQVHRLASKYQDKIDYRLIDDKKNILKPIETFYSAHPDLLPANFTIQGEQYGPIGSSYISTLIQGTGHHPHASLNFFNLRLLFDFSEEPRHEHELIYTAEISGIRYRLFEAHPGQSLGSGATDQETKKLSKDEVGKKAKELTDSLDSLKAKKDIVSICQYKKVHYALEYLEKNEKEIDADKIKAIDSLCEEEKRHSSHLSQHQMDMTFAKIMAFNTAVGILFAPTRSVEERTWWQNRSLLTKAVIVGVVAAILVGAALTGVGLIVEAALGVSIVGASLFIGAGSFFSAGVFSTGIAAGGIGAAVVSGVSSFVSGIFYYIKQSCFPSPEAGVQNRDAARVLASHPPHSLEKRPTKALGGSGITYVQKGILRAPDLKDPPAAVGAPPPAVGAHSPTPTTRVSRKPK